MSFWSVQCSAVQTIIICAASDRRRTSNNSRVCGCAGGVESLREFLRLEYSEENLEFWMECEAFKQAHATHVRSPTAAPSANSAGVAECERPVSGAHVAEFPGTPTPTPTPAICIAADDSPRTPTADTPKHVALNGSATKTPGCPPASGDSFSMSTPSSQQQPSQQQPSQQQAAAAAAAADAPECAKCGGECGSCGECARLATEIVERFLSPTSPKEVPRGRGRRIFDLRRNARPATASNR